MNKEYTFEKQGIKFSFRNPKWNKLNKQLKMEWKVFGYKENKENDGYFYNSDFMSENEAMDISGTKINGKEVRGVKLPENILLEIKALYEKMKADDLNNRLASDIRYVLNDNTSYGIYNGISEFDITEIFYDLKKKFNADIMLFQNDIADILNRDIELEEIAMANYQADPEGNWNEEYLTWFKKAKEQKEAPGYGMIPNNIIRDKITKIIITVMKKENDKREVEQNNLNNLQNLARETGKNQQITQWLEDCNDPEEECSTDICQKWITPEGKIVITRSHTW